MSTQEPAEKGSTMKALKVLGLLLAWPLLIVSGACLAAVALSLALARVLLEVAFG